MKESVLKANLVKTLRESLRTFVIMRLEDRISSGYPDIVISGNKITSWIEVKYGNPNFASKGIQELTMLRLASAGFASYIVYWEKLAQKRTYIVEPKDIGKPIIEWMNYVEGFDHSFVLGKVRLIHNLT